MAMFNYSDRDNLTPWNSRIDKINVVLTYVYSAEAVFKIFAQGFVWGKQTYLKSYWNILDFAIVVSG